MSEKAMWNTLRKRMGKGKYWAQATRHEDTAELGIADVSFVNNDGAHGWIELKQVDAWPVRESTILRLEHYTDEQRSFLKRKGRAGGNTWLLLKVARDWLLFDWLAGQAVGALNRAQLFEAAHTVCEGRLDGESLGAALCDGSNF